MINTRLMVTDKRTINRVMIQAEIVLQEKVTGCERLQHGMTNFNYKIFTKHGVYVYRVPGDASNLLIDRYEEREILQQIRFSELDVETIHYEVPHGNKLTRFIENIPITDYILPKRSVIVSQLLKRLHSSGLVFRNKFCPMERINFYENVLISHQISFYKDFPANKRRLEYLCHHFPFIQSSELSPCHNDIVPQNILLAKSGRAYLIDWEYAGMNHHFWDLASYCIENNLNRNEETAFLAIYLMRDVNDDDRQKIIIFKIFQDILWSLWAAIKVHFGAHFGYYGKDRYDRGCNNLKAFHNITDRVIYS